MRTEHLRNQRDRLPILGQYSKQRQHSSALEKGRLSRRQDLEGEIQVQMAKGANIINN
jgi:hypothetical protein